jgi:hypothetical protein
MPLDAERKRMIWCFDRLEDDQSILLRATSFEEAGGQSLGRHGLMVAGVHPQRSVSADACK